MRRTPGNPGLKGRLLDHSIEAYVLALEIINRLSTRYREDAFAYLICNAWERLLKAKLILDARRRDAIYYPKKRGEPPRTLALRACLKLIFTDEKDPIRRNVEKVADLRDEATHLVIGHVPPNVLGLFQACVLNFHQCLGDWFGIALSDRVTPGMMALVYDLSPEQADPHHPVLRRRLGREAADYLARLEAEIRAEYDALGRPAQFTIPD